jgi:SAM-dependent methyltransferase
MEPPSMTKQPNPALAGEFLYQRLADFLARGVLRRDESVLVVCGGRFDQDVLDLLGFTNVTISSLDLPPGVDPARFRVADAEALPLPDDSFDVVLVHAGIHHCASPHRAVCEMYRVARRAVIVFEAQDSLLMRLLGRLGLAAAYELDAVTLNDCSRGGVRDSATPNYVYRWTRRELEKVIRSFDPAREPSILVFTSLHFNEWGLEGHMGRHPLVRHLPRPFVRSVARIGIAALNVILSRQGNTFVAVICKSGAQPMPWMRWRGSELVFEPDPPPAAESRA